MKLFTEEEINFIKRTKITANITDPKTIEAFSWWNRGIVLKVVDGVASQEEVLIYKRMKEVDNLIALLSGGVPRTIHEYMLRSDGWDEEEKEFMMKAMLENSFYDVEDTFHLSYLRKMFKEEYEQDLDEPFIENMINQMQREYEEKEEYGRIYATMQNVEFKALDDDLILNLLLLLYRDLNDSNIKKRMMLRTMDNKMLVYLIVRYSSKISMTLDKETKKKKH